MQNEPKIRPNKSSAVNIPVISSSACCACAQFLGHQLAGAPLRELARRSFDAFAARVPVPQGDDVAQKYFRYPRSES